ncbi:hypothetical protein DCAR_0933770 [Daucus carota subsp. sativus]|uniref:Reverse transcriptase domain-containing protein n=1 Tax=Daucus carota subsp. sativus TaxID=79200 RepID=A0AAF0XTY6_DAUCS|nr:hypothetical protein DCAR_0933770 [Daucus carota subsp. sativus]
MHPDKASGPDGLNPAFFQHFWPMLGREVFECCKEWLLKCTFPADFNNTNLVLIPKKVGANCMKDFRPIALCNVLYKILAKVLGNRLKIILPDLISETQSAFVPGRSITDNVLIAFEVIHHMKRKHGGGEGGVALKLDISKAYDRVDWNFLKHRMRSMGFCNRWINWIMMCASTVSYEVCVNGSSVGPITPKRGLRQGDPLSPTLCQEIERMLNNFWWNSGNGGNKGIRWLSWDSLSSPKCKGGLSFRNMHGFNISLLGKHCWKFINQPQALVSRVFIARYFSDSHLLKASKGTAGSSFIWTGLFAAKEALFKGFRWVLGDGKAIVAVEDPWLRRKRDFKVENCHMYEGRNEKVSGLFLPGTKQWDVNLVKANFHDEDAQAILAVPIPQQEVGDRVAWSSFS